MGILRFRMFIHTEKTFSIVQLFMTLSIHTHGMLFKYVFVSQVYVGGSKSSETNPIQENWFILRD